jgi:hypothetical protein
VDILAKHLDWEGMPPKPKKGTIEREVLERLLEGNLLTCDDFGMSEDYLEKIVRRLGSGDYIVNTQEFDEKKESKKQ